MAQPTQERLASELEKPQQTSGNVGHAGSGTEPENSPHYQDHDDEHVHHVAMSTYYVVFAFLIVMLLITVGAWYIDQHVHSLGHLSTPIAMAIAVAKAVAIVLIFMHVKFSSKLVQIFACTGVAFVTVMFVLTLQDYTTRDWLPRSGIYTPQPSEDGSVGGNGQSSGEIIRSSSVGAGYNGQSTPSDNMVAMAGNTTSTGRGYMPSAPVLNSSPATGAPASGTTATGTTTSGTTANTGVVGADVRVIPNAAGATTQGATSMTGAMAANGTMTQGGSPQSAGQQSGSSLTQGAEQSGASGASGMASGRQDVATNGSASSPGPIIGGAANNSYGSAAQSAGIEPKPAAPASKPAAPASKPTGSKPVASMAGKPAPAAPPAPATR